MYIAENVPVKQKAFSNYNRQAFGGTEYMAINFLQKIAPDVPKFDEYRSLIFPGVTVSYDQLADGTPTIIWLHNLLDQFRPEVLELFKNEKFINSLKFIIVVSEYHKQSVIEDTGIDADKIVVIPNAIDKLNYDTKKFSRAVKKPVIMHCSSPERGMDVLLTATQLIEEDFELKIFNAFYPDLSNLSEQGKKIIFDKRISFYGKTPRMTVLKNWESAHIHAYPTIFEESSCITQMEALATNCLSVYGNYAALQETSLGYGMPVETNFSNINKYIEDYAEALTKAITMVKNKEFVPGDQAKIISSTYSWEMAKQRWIDLHDQL